LKKNLRFLKISDNIKSLKLNSYSHIVTFIYYTIHYGLFREFSAFGFPVINNIGNMVRQNEVDQ
jgi:hypothetical protein